ncbi:deoxyribodipyrimidine photo-lyase [Alteromonas macleodii]|uniref:deoxyribodipyrimidine photo-lyase n=1 Tax=Alteromonas macleodii TaxID=28108 RepID=UPI003BAFA163
MVPVHSKQSVTVIWFKRDLRLRDHEPLYRAVEKKRKHSSAFLLGTFPYSRPAYGHASLAIYPAKYRRH